MVNCVHAGLEIPTALLSRLEVEARHFPSIALSLSLSLYVSEPNNKQVLKLAQVAQAEDIYIFYDIIETT